MSIVVTTGIVVVVGVSSYCTYHCLQRLRQDLAKLKWMERSTEKVEGPEESILEEADLGESLQLVPVSPEQKVMGWSAANSSAEWKRRGGGASSSSNNSSLELKSESRLRPSHGRQLLSSTDDDPESQISDDEIEVRLNALRMSWNWNTPPM